QMNTHSFASMFSMRARTQSPNWGAVGSQRPASLRVPHKGKVKVPRDLRELSCDLSGFPSEHRAFSRQPPVVAGDVAALSDHPMARHHEADRFLSDREADGAGASR